MSDLKWDAEVRSKFSDVNYMLDLYEISKENGFDIYIKGSSLLHLIQDITGKVDFYRGTRDIDLNIIDVADEEKAIREFKEVLEKIKGTQDVQSIKKMQDGYKVKLNTDQGVEFLDVKFKEDFPHSADYEIDGIVVKGSSLEKIVADKLTTTSSNHIYRRMKDVYDLYIVLKNYKIDYKILGEILKEVELGDFSKFFDKELSIFHMNNQRRLEGFPSNEEVYDFVFNSILLIINESLGGEKVCRFPDFHV